MDMDKGIIYLMTTAVSGLIKIGKTETKNFEKRFYHLEGNGYYNVSGLTRYFAIEVDEYSDKEVLLQDIFEKYRLAKSELFAVDIKLVKRLLLAFGGKVIYEKDSDDETNNKNKSIKKEGDNAFTFYRKGIKNGEKIVFKYDESVVAEVVGEKHVSFEGKTWLLTTLAKEIFVRLGTPKKSFYGASGFTYDGTTLLDLPDKTL